MRLRLPALAYVPLVVAALAVLIGLGVWQLSRWDYKQGLESSREARIAEPPLRLDPGSATPPPDNLDYRRVALEGAWDVERIFAVRQFRFGIRGEELVMPLFPEGRDTAVLVDRGWYPLSERERVLGELVAEPAGVVTGLVRYVTGGSARQTAAGAWTRYDVPAMAATLPYPVEPWGVIEGQLLERQRLTPPRDLPVRGYLAYKNHVPHLEYALTWFGIAVTLVATIAVGVARRRSP